MIRTFVVISLFAAVLHVSCGVLQAQEPPATVQDLNDLLPIQAIPGYEGRLTQELRSELASLHSTTDNLET